MKRIFLSLLSLCAISLYAQSDSLSTHSIDELVVEEVRQPLVRYNTLGTTYWSIKTMEAMPMADPLRNIQLLPGVQTDFYTMQNQSRVCNFSGSSASEGMLPWQVPGSPRAGASRLASSQP